MAYISVKLDTGDIVGFYDQMRKTRDKSKELNIYHIPGDDCIICIPS
jgi:hypothetical protein